MKNFERRLIAIEKICKPLLEPPPPALQIKEEISDDEVERMREIVNKTRINAGGHWETDNSKLTPEDIAFMKTLFVTPKNGDTNENEPAKSIEKD